MRNDRTLASRKPPSTQLIYCGVRAQHMQNSSENGYTLNAIKTRATQKSCDVCILCTRCIENNHHLERSWIGAIFIRTTVYPLNVFVQIGYDFKAPRQRFADLQCDILWWIGDNWLVIHPVCRIDTKNDYINYYPN